MRIWAASFCILWVGLFALAPATSAHAQAKPTDLGDRSFSADEIVRALAPRQGEVRSQRSRGIGAGRGLVVTEAPASEAPSATERRSVSMQLQFDFDSARLTPSAQERLDVVGAALRAPELSNGRYLFSGHTDATGRYEYNLALSKRRAEAVRDYLLVRHSIEPRRLLTVGRASDELIDPANPDSGVNRRVQLEALD